jgi:hypothetical protein
VEYTSLPQLQAAYRAAFGAGFDAPTFRDDVFYAAQILEKSIRDGNAGLRALAREMEDALADTIETDRIDVSAGPAAGRHAGFAPGFAAGPADAPAAESAVVVPAAAQPAKAPTAKAAPAEPAAAKSAAVKPSAAKPVAGKPAPAKPAPANRAPRIAGPVTFSPEPFVPVVYTPPSPSSLADTQRMATLGDTQPLAILGEGASPDAGPAEAVPGAAIPSVAIPSAAIPDDAFDAGTPRAAPAVDAPDRRRNPPSTDDAERQRVAAERRQRASEERRLRVGTGAGHVRLDEHEIYLLSQLRIQYRRTYGAFFDIFEFTGNDLYARTLLKLSVESGNEMLALLARQFMNDEGAPRLHRRKGKADVEIVEAE